MADPILILPIDVGPLPEATAALLAEKGIAVIYMDDPSRAVTLHLAPAVGADILTRCALQVVRENPMNTHTMFGVCVAEAALAVLREGK